MSIDPKGDTRVTLVHPGYGTGDYFYPGYFLRATTAVISATPQFVAYPFFVPHDLSVSALSIYLAASGLNSKLMLGIYDHSFVTRKAGALIAPIAAELDLSSGITLHDGALAASKLLLQGTLYWCCAQTNGSVANVTCANNAAAVHNPLLPVNLGLLQNANSNAGGLAVANAYVTNTMPPNAPASLIPAAATNLPLPVLKVA